MKIIRKITVGIILVLTVASLMGCGKEKDEEEKLVIRIGSNAAIGTITPYLAEELGYFEGKDYEIEIIEFTDASVIMEAMAAGEVDLGIGGVCPIATWNAKGLDARVVASANGGGHVVLTTTEQDITSIEDLKGKIVAGPNPGTVTDSLFRSYILPRYGLTIDDMTIVTGMSCADMVTALANTNEVDAIVAWEPFVSMGELSYDNIQVLFDMAEEWTKDGNTELYPVNVIAASGEFCDEHETELRDVLQTIEKTVKYVDENHAEACQKIADLLEMDADVIEHALERSKLTFKVDIDATMATLGWAHEAGYLDKIPEEDKLFDFNYIAK